MSNNVGVMAEIEPAPCATCIKQDLCATKRLACDQFVLYVEKHNAPKRLRRAKRLRRRPNAANFARIYNVPINGSTTTQQRPIQDGEQGVRPRP